MDLSLNSVNSVDPFDMNNEKLTSSDDVVDMNERTNLRPRVRRGERQEKSARRGRKSSTKPAADLAVSGDGNLSPAAAQPVLAVDAAATDYQGQDTEPDVQSLDTADSVETEPMPQLTEPGHSTIEPNDVPETTDLQSTKEIEDKLDATCLGVEVNESEKLKESNKTDAADVDPRLPPATVEAKTVTVDTSVSQMQSSVLQALGLTRGIGMSFANTLSLAKNMTVMAGDSSTKLTLASSATAAGAAASSGAAGSGALAKTVPLLVNMKGAGTGPSLLPANLPPGRYVIISSTTATATTTPLTTLTTTTSGHVSTITTSVGGTSLPNTGSVPQGPTTTSSSITSTAAGAHKSSRFSAVVRAGNMAAGVRTPVGKTRGMRKSYTTSEKLAMIEAVESGLKKSVVADRFGVAPSTLACIILQKDKIRRDQSKSSLGRRRLRPSSALQGSSSNTHNLQSTASFKGDSGSPETGDHVFAGTNASYVGPANSGSAACNTSSPGGGMESRSPLPFTHFLANLDQSMSFDSAPPEEIVSVPDLSESLPYSSAHGGSSTTPSHLSYSEAQHQGAVALSEGGHSEGSARRQLEGEEGPEDLSYSDDGEDDTAAAGAEKSSLTTARENHNGAAIELGDGAAATSASDCDDGASATDAVGSTGAGGVGGAGPELSGLCLVKREVHCYSVLDQLMKDSTYTDVTLTTDGHTFHAHKIVLCMASSYFRRVLNDNSPGVRNVVVLRDIPHGEMRNILQFLYTGEATVDASELQSFMKTAQQLEISSLCDNTVHFPNSSQLHNLSQAMPALAHKQLPLQHQHHQQQLSASQQKEQLMLKQRLMHSQQVHLKRPEVNKLLAHLQKRPSVRESMPPPPPPPPAAATNLQNQKEVEQRQDQQMQMQQYIQQHIKRQIESLTRLTSSHERVTCSRDTDFEMPSSPPLVLSHTKNFPALKTTAEDMTIAAALPSPPTSTLCNGGQLGIRVRSEQSLTENIPIAVNAMETLENGAAGDSSLERLENTTHSSPLGGKHESVSTDMHLSEKLKDGSHVEECDNVSMKQGNTDSTQLSELNRTSKQVDNDITKPPLDVRINSVLDATQVFEGVAHEQPGAIEDLTTENCVQQQHTTSPPDNCFDNMNDVQTDRDTTDDGSTFSANEQPFEREGEFPNKRMKISND